MITSQTHTQRQRIRVQGIVQGVGFRPFVYLQATRLSLAGWVQNTSNGVSIEVEGPHQALAAFRQALREEAPPLARILSLSTEDLSPRFETGFAILESQPGSERYALVSPDMTICDDCLHELFDPADRRYRYPFINCTHCGPRFTIIQDVPYDRAKTTMHAFPLCPTCQAEYDDPSHRRFHAQPNACPHCGPQVSLIATKGAHTRLDGLSCDSQSIGREEPLSPDTSRDTLSLYLNPLQQAAHLLASGAILALKGLGGYHLACDALNKRAVERLRRLKRREARPFALMVPDIRTAQQLCYISEAETALLQAQSRPIVLLDQRPGNPIAPAVAPDHQTLGIMLPYTPLHYLLLHTLTQFSAPSRPIVLVMTSGNLSDEPIAYQDTDAYKRLQNVADAILLHNRAIYMRCDDSVVQISAAGAQFLRRSRGYTPEPLPLVHELPVPLLACGGHLKNTFCLGKGKLAFLSQHIGDVENLETLLSFHEGIQHFQRLFDISPNAIAYDLHPEYLTTKYALASAIPCKIGIQHHHAHIASVLAEHGLTEAVIGIAADGSGYGTDGALWGCEIMIAHLEDFHRLAHLDYMPLPGGEQAIHQPWRMAAAYLARTYGETFLQLDLPFVRHLDRTAWHILAQMITKNLNCPQTSSLGRLFDAIAALLGLYREVKYEGQAAIALEMLAMQCRDDGASYPFVLRPDRSRLQDASLSSPCSLPSITTSFCLDVAPLIDAIVQDSLQGVPVEQIARSFHLTIAHMLTATCVDARRQTGLTTVALSGGVFQNRLLLKLLLASLEQKGFQTVINRRIPPNDGGLSLGQMAIAAARLQGAQKSH